MGKTSRASFDNICAHIQGVVTYTSPVEAFATGIKNLDRCYHAHLRPRLISCASSCASAVLVKLKHAGEMET